MAPTAATDVAAARTVELILRGHEYGLAERGFINTLINKVRRPCPRR